MVAKYESKRTDCLQGVQREFFGVMALLLYLDCGGWLHDYMLFDRTTHYIG